MSEEAEKDRGFKVQDRRRFSAEGEARGEGAPPPPESAPDAAPVPESAKPREETESIEVTLSAFVVGLSTQALIALGEIEDPADGERQSDLRAGQQLIDIIAMLQNKTRGNLDADEARLLEAILFELRMKYVELARKPVR
jgi:hypothetical protein